MFFQNFSKYLKLIRSDYQEVYVWQNLMPVTPFDSVKRFKSYKIFIDTFTHAHIYVTHSYRHTNNVVLIVGKGFQDHKTQSSGKINNKNTLNSHFINRAFNIFSAYYLFTMVVSDYQQFSFYVIKYTVCVLLCVNDIDNFTDEAISIKISSEQSNNNSLRIENNWYQDIINEKQ